MGIQLIRLSESDVNVAVFSGAITREVLLGFYNSLGREVVDNGARWLSYFDPTADLTELDLATFTEMRRVIAARLRELYGETALTSGVVCDSPANLPVLKVWNGYVGDHWRDPDAPVMYSSLRAACDAFGLSDQARAELGAAIGVDCAPPPTGWVQNAG